MLNGLADDFKTFGMSSNNNAYMESIGFDPTDMFMMGEEQSSIMGMRQHPQSRGGMFSKIFK